MNSFTNVYRYRRCALVKLETFLNTYIVTCPILIYTDIKIDDPACRPAYSAVTKKVFRPIVLFQGLTSVLTTRKFMNSFDLV